MIRCADPACPLAIFRDLLVLLCEIANSTQFFPNAVSALIQAMRREPLPFTGLPLPLRFITARLIGPLTASLVKNTLDFLMEKTPFREMYLNLVISVVADQNVNCLNGLRTSLNLATSELGSWMRCVAGPVTREDAAMIVPRLLSDRVFSREQLDWIEDSVLIQNLSHVRVEENPVVYLVLKGVAAIASEIVHGGLAAASGLATLGNARESPLQPSIVATPGCSLALIEAVASGEMGILEKKLPDVTLHTVTEWLAIREGLKSGEWSFRFNARDSPALRKRYECLRSPEEEDGSGIHFFRYCLLRDLPIGPTWSFTRAHDLLYFAILLNKAPEKLISSILPEILPLRWSQVLASHFPAALHPGITAVESFKPVCEYYLKFPEMMVIQSNNKLEQKMIEAFMKQDGDYSVKEFRDVDRMIDIIQPPMLIPPLTDLTQELIFRITFALEVIGASFATLRCLCCSGRHVSYLIYARAFAPPSFTLLQQFLSRLLVRDSVCRSRGQLLSAPLIARLNSSFSLVRTDSRPMLRHAQYVLPGLEETSGAPVHKQRILDFATKPDFFHWSVVFTGRFAALSMVKFTFSVGESPFDTLIDHSGAEIGLTRFEPREPPAFALWRRVARLMPAIIRRRMLCNSFCAAAQCLAASQNDLQIALTALGVEGGVPRSPRECAVEVERLARRAVAAALVADADRTAAFSRFPSWF
jgi:hypothetical protein